MWVLSFFTSLEDSTHRWLVTHCECVCVNYGKFFLCIYSIMYTYMNMNMNIEYMFNIVNLLHSLFFLSCLNAHLNWFYFSVDFVSNETHLRTTKSNYYENNDDFPNSNSHGKCENKKKVLFKWCNYVILLIQYLWTEIDLYRDRHTHRQPHKHACAPLLVRLSIIDLELYRYR